MGLSEADRNRLLRRVQHEVPFIEQPFAAIAADLGFHEDEVLAELRALRESGLLREISAVLEGSALGYDSALVACSVAPADLERAYHQLLDADQAIKTGRLDPEVAVDLLVAELTVR